MSDTLDLQFRRAPAARADKLDVAERTFEACWSTGADVRRRSYAGDFIERLSMDPKHVRLDRLNAGASVLDSHSGYSMRNRVGSVVPGSARIENGKDYAAFRLSTNEIGEGLLRDLKAGHRLHLSPGYRTFKVEKTERRNQLPIHRAIDWEPYEISVVLVPADANAHTRAMEVPMDPEVIEEVETTTPAPATPRQRGLPIAERRSLARQLAEKFPVPAADLDELISETRGADDKAFRTAFMDLWGSTRHRIDTRHDMLHNDHSLDNPQVRAAAMGEALFARLDPSVELSEPARQFAGLTVPELARHALQASGQAITAMSAATVVTRALNTTSDFPQLLADTVGRSLRAAYQAAPSAIKQVARKTTARDFRAKHHLTFSEAPRLEKVNEHGEFKRGTFKEAGESYAVDTFGRVFGITRQSLVNDDLSAFERVPRALGQAAEAFEAQFLVDHLQANPAMADGKGVFHSDHGNLAATATPLSTEALSVARTAMRRQKGLTGELIAVAPKYLIVAPELETTAEKVLAEIAAAKTEDVNVFSKALTLVVEPRLTLNSGLTWYLSAPTGQIDGLEYAYLEGFEGPYLESRAGFDVDGVEIKVRLDFGAGFVEHRGWYRNDGAAAD